jgi:hypothetical protein
MDEDSEPECSVERHGHDLFVVFDGKRIAMRGKQGTLQAGTWVSLEPGYVVTMDRKTLYVEYNDARVH